MELPVPAKSRLHLSSTKCFDSLQRSRLGEDQPGQDIQYYQVLYSVDGVTWNPIGILPISNNEIQHYIFTDEDPAKGRNYYKLRIFDESGTSLETAIVIVLMNEKSGLHVYPNPAFTQLTLDGMKDILQISVQDMQGRSMVKERIGGAASKTLSVAEVPAGAYIISIFDNNGIIRYRQKFVNVSN